MTITNDPHRPPARDEAAKPLAPLWLFRALNPLMRALLRSPLHGLLSGMLMLLTFTGRKSGRTYTIPIGYFVWGADELMAFSSARWWTNLRDGTKVTLLLKGQRLEAVPTVIHDRVSVIATLEEFITRLGLATAQAPSRAAARPCADAGGAARDPAEFHLRPFQDQRTAARTITFAAS